MTDILNEILEPKKRADTNGGSGHYLVTSPRFESSKASEAAEAEYLAKKFLPTPFYNEAGELEPLSKQDLAQLKEMDVTPDEYKVLVGAMSIEAYEQLMESQS